MCALPTDKLMLCKRPLIDFKIAIENFLISFKEL